MAAGWIYCSSCSLLCRRGCVLWQLQFASLSSLISHHGSGVRCDCAGHGTQGHTQHTHAGTTPSAAQLVDLLLSACSHALPFFLTVLFCCALPRRSASSAVCCRSRARRCCTWTATPTTVSERTSPSSWPLTLGACRACPHVLLVLWPPLLHQVVSARP